ncbi:DNA excision repair protein ERCC-1-like [Puma concolor]|uniref:DNA excision repair protein ERCC-1-like n=1 Tax=Puma concolor TaxID=9696 RepID=A0A6P6H2S6_PUMCO|nr:DNA excision repair protein ERCC-1-like [Puma concolor]
MDEEGVRQPSGPPTRKKFFIPLDEDEAPTAGFKPLFKSTRSLPTMETSAQAAPQTYAEYAISGPPGGAGAPHPTGPEPLAGETPNQAPKLGTKSSSIIVSPRQRPVKTWDVPAEEVPGTARGPGRAPPLPPIRGPPLRAGPVAIDSPGRRASPWLSLEAGGDAGLVTAPLGRAPASRAFGWRLSAPRPEFLPRN